MEIILQLPGCMCVCVCMCAHEKKPKKIPRIKTSVKKICHKYSQYILTASAAISSDPKLIHTERFYKCY